MYLIFNRVVLKYDGLYIVLGFIGFSFEDFVLNFIGRYKVVDFFMFLYDRIYLIVIMINI